MRNRFLLVLFVLALAVALPWALVIYLVWFVLAFSHEGGHYLAQRIVGVAPDRFELGKRLPWATFAIGETRFRLCVDCFGGEVPEDHFAHSCTGPAGYAFFCLAGPLVNLLTAAAIFICLAPSDANLLFYVPEQFVLVLGNIVKFLPCGVTHGFSSWPIEQIDDSAINAAWATAHMAVLMGASNLVIPGASDGWCAMAYAYLAARRRRPQQFQRTFQGLSDFGNSPWVAPAVLLTTIVIGLLLC